MFTTAGLIRSTTSAKLTSECAGRTDRRRRGAVRAIGSGRGGAAATTDGAVQPAGEDRADEEGDDGGERDGDEGEAARHVSRTEVG